MSQVNNVRTVRFDSETDKFLKEKAKQMKIPVSEYIRRCVTGEETDSDRAIKLRVTSQVESLKENLDAQTAALESQIKAMNDLILEMQYRFYATWVFFSKPRAEIEKTKNIVIAVDEIAAQIAESESKNA